MVYLKSYDSPAVNEREILRYAGAGKSADELLPLLRECLREIEGRLAYRVCYREFDISFRDGVIDLGFTVTDSRDLAKNLSRCKKIVVFAATVGVEMDRLIARYSSNSPARAVMLQAIGNERVESLCNTFNKEIAERYAAEGNRTRPRFSAGYGDLPLSIQTDIFATLDCPRKIGVTLNQSLFMSPSKSVTAIIGIAENKTES